MTAVCISTSVLRFLIFRSRQIPMCCLIDERITSASSSSAAAEVTSKFGGRVQRHLD